MKRLIVCIFMLLLSACSNQQDTSNSQQKNRTTQTINPTSEEQILSAAYLAQWSTSASASSNPNSSTFRLPKTIEFVVQKEFLTPRVTQVSNAEAVIPPQCYTQHEKKYNPCMTCHQSYPFGSRPNGMNDGDLQREYGFSDIGVTNHWTNLFEDRTARIAKISDQAAIDYVFQDNYSPLIAKLETSTSWIGPVPRIKNLQLGALAFDAQGFAKDGSQWVAFNYKPLPSTFWPTNGSTDDVMIRLPEDFRSSACATATISRESYLANLAILEMAIKDKNTISVPSIDERNICQDINGDGKMTILEELKRPAHYVGGAAEIAVTPMLYPVGVEFLHSVRYLGVNPAGDIFLPPRMKELRYMQKTHFYDRPALVSLYGNESQEKLEGALPSYVYRETGSQNGFGWKILGFIEAKEGHLRIQNNEETAFCMGCHTTIGSTIDQTFSFARKVDGATGWGYINLKGMRDAPTFGSGRQQGEIEHYLETVGGGDEFRQNKEILDKWFDANGKLLTDKVRAAPDVYSLITPSVERALKLNKAYMTIVADQDFNQGRDANFIPAANVYKKVDGEHAPVLPKEKTQKWDLRLDWSK